MGCEKKGIPTSPAIFIPFMGALIGMKEMPKNAKDEAYIAYMGCFSDFCHFTSDTALYNDERAILGACYFAWKYD